MKPAGSPSDSSETLAEAALAGIPGFAGRQLRYAPAVPGVASPSYHGVESTTYAVALDDEPPAYFLKISAPEIAASIDHAAAFDAASKVAAIGLAPEPLHVDPQRGATLFHHLGPDWRAARMDDVLKPDVLSAIIAAQNRIAAGEAFGRDWSVFDGIRELYTIIVDDPSVLPADAWWLVEAMAPIEAAISAAGIDLKPAQADPHPSNIMLGPDGAVKLVDFDMAANVDPYYPLGVILNEAFQFDSEMQAGLEMHDGAFRQGAFNRCRLYGAADDLYWALRGLLLDRLSPRKGLEFRKYAGWRFLRCRMLVNRPGFEELLRTL